MVVNIIHFPLPTLRVAGGCLERGSLELSVGELFWYSLPIALRILMALAYYKVICSVCLKPSGQIPGIHGGSSKMISQVPTL